MVEAPCSNVKTCRRKYRSSNRDLSGALPGRQCPIRVEFFAFSTSCVLTGAAYYDRSNTPRRKCIGGGILD
jgi:hypothetical protein